MTRKISHLILDLKLSFEKLGLYEMAPCSSAEIQTLYTGFTCYVLQPSSETALPEVKAREERERPTVAFELFHLTDE